MTASTSNGGVIHRLLAVARGCDADLTNHDVLVALVKAAATRAGLTVVGETVYAFVPHGLTIALVLAQSHLVVSTWPELRAATADVVACGHPDSPRLVWEALINYLRPVTTRVDQQTISLMEAGQQ